MQQFWNRLSRTKRLVPLMRSRVDLTALDPRSIRIYVLPDIHGCIDALLSAEDRIFKDMGADKTPALLIYLGDYVDRGPRSALVLDHLINSTLPGTRRITLCGNHDDLFLSAVTGRVAPLGWIQIGGRQTLQSYGMSGECIDMLARNRAKFAKVVGKLIPPSHVRFLQSLPISVRIGKTLLFVHAGILPGRPLDEQKDEHMIWIREPFLTVGPRLPLTVIHGHTIVSEPIFENSRIGLDTGAYLNGRLAVLKVIGNNFVLI